MSRQIPLPRGTEAKYLEEERNVSGPVSDVVCKRIALVNVVYVGPPGTRDRGWVLVDAGIGGAATTIRKAAERRFGEGSRPSGIVLTHGHFDHVGALKDLAELWDVPVYAHPLEHPYLNGQERYPAPDPTVGGGVMSVMAALYPRGPMDVSRWLQALPEGEVPGLPGWTWVHTPGHSRGHVSLWRESDRMLIAGDAFITTNQESAYSAAVQRPELHGPPMYYTTDWEQARESVRRLAELDPEFVVTGHGRPMEGKDMRAALRLLAHDFDRIAVPEPGRYLDAA